MGCQLGSAIKCATHEKQRVANLSEPVVVVVGVVVEWLYYSKRIIIVRSPDLSEFVFVDFRLENVCFVSHPMTIVTFLQKNGDPAKRVVDFPLERDTFRNKIMEIVEDFPFETQFLHFSFFFL